MLVRVEFSESILPLADRQAEFERWVREVREPANMATEGPHRVDVTGAEAEYEIAPLPSGHWAVRIRIGYLCGNCSGRSGPWTEHADRQHCVDAFLTAARQHFVAELSESDPIVNEAQRRARRDMLNALEGGLFGFIEPNSEMRGP